jgi:hypothetical protein
MICLETLQAELRLLAAGQIIILQSNGGSLAARELAPEICTGR